MKAAAVILTETFCEFVDKVPYALGLQIVTDEESGGEDGTLHQIERGVRGDFIICGECGRPPTKYEIANACKGYFIGGVGFSGNSSHGAYPWRGDNAIVRASRFANALMERYPTPSEETYSTTVTITSIATTNQAHSKVPDNAVVMLDIRFTSEDPNFRSIKNFASLVKELDPDAEVARVHSFSSPVFCNPENTLMKSLKASAEKIEGKPFNFAMRHGTFDGRYYADIGDEACEFGISGEHQHADGENITLEAFDNYRATMHDFLSKTIESEKQNTNTKTFNG